MEIQYGPGEHIEAQKKLRVERDVRKALSLRQKLAARPRGARVPVLRIVRPIYRKMR